MHFIWILYLFSSIDCMEFGGPLKKPALDIYLYHPWVCSFYRGTICIFFVTKWVIFRGWPWWSKVLVIESRAVSWICCYHHISVTRASKMMFSLSVIVCIDAKGLQMTAHVESLREKVYVTLEEYCRRQYPDDPGRFAKLLLRLPALRTIGLKCASYLFLSQLCQAEGSSPETYISLLMKGIYTS